MAYTKKVAVVIPFYRNTISNFEAMALQQCQKVLGTHTLIAIKPHSLTLPNTGNLSLTDTISFDDAYFASIAGYNRLMLAEEFYHAFLDYEYILIYQMDAFVFSDQLLHWCNQGFDYIGAPWLRYIGHVDMVKAVKSNLKYYTHTRFDVKVNGMPSPMQFENRVGNGGFSLRRVQKFHEITQTRQADIQRYLAQEGHHQYNEDAFWSIEVNRKKKFLHIPDYKTAVGFAFELAPDRALKINHNQLPFGCHAWDRYLEFWRPYFVQEGYPQMDYNLIANFEAEVPVDIKYLYRISDAGNPKPKLHVATKMNCLDNFIKEFKNNLYVFADNCSEETLQAIKSRGINPVVIALGNSNSWRYIVQAAIKNFNENSFVYLVEDDYLHLPGSLTALQQGLAVADYVTLYDHPDKYSDENGSSPNPQVTQGGELSRVIRTSITHWKQTNSTTMTFATKVKTLKEDQDIWWRFTKDALPDDFHAFQTLLNGDAAKGKNTPAKKRTLISPLPGFATHAELAYLAPLTQWHSIKSWEDIECK